MAYTLPDLPYPENALEPHIDAQTMNIHRTKHHQAYINNVECGARKASRTWPTSRSKLCSANWPRSPKTFAPSSAITAAATPTTACSGRSWVPSAAASRRGDLAEAIKKEFGSIATFREQFNKAATTRFGSGWAWLTVNKGKLAVESTANQDSPLSEGRTPILGLDVWEHAYYLKYQNKRPDYITAFWNVVNWGEVAKRFAAAK